MVKSELWHRMDCSCQRFGGTHYLHLHDYSPKHGGGMFLESRLGVVVGSVLATGPKGRWFKSGRGEGFFRVIKIRSASSDAIRFNGTLKLSWRTLDAEAKNLTPSSILPTCFQISLLVGLPESSSGRVRSFLQPATLSPWFSALTYHLGGWRVGPLVAPVLRYLSPST
jgi:hypothetical protein